MHENIENLEPNQSPELADLIRDNIDFQQNQNIKKTLFKESMIKVSLDKDFKDLFDGHSEHDQEEDSLANNFIQVTSEIKEVCCWLEDSSQFKGMAYMPFHSLAKLMHILHQKVENTVLVVAEYQQHWLQKMEEMARLYKIKWGFINLSQTKQEKIKVLQLYQMHKIKLLFVSPAIFKHEQYLEFQSDVLVVPDLHLYSKSTPYLGHIVEKCSPGRVLALYSSLMRQSYQNSFPDFTPINSPNSDNRTCICLKTSTEQKYKTFLSYHNKNQMKRTLIVVRDRTQASTLSKKLKLMSMSTYNMFQSLTCQDFTQFSVPDILYRINAQEDKVMEAVRRSKNYNITISKYFDALRFGNFDCIVFFNFTDVPKFIQLCPDTPNRVALLVDDDYYKLRNQITCEYIGQECLVKIVMKIMEKPKKKQGNCLKRFYSDCVDDKIFDCYSISKEYASKDEEKVIRINWFCKSYDVSYRNFKKVIDALCKQGVINQQCKLTYEIQVQQESLPAFRKMFPDAVEVRRRVNLLNLSTEVHKTTRTLLQQMRENNIQFKVTEKALQLKIKKGYEEVNWNSLGQSVNEQATQAARDMDKSYYLYKEYSYGSVELTRRQKSLQRKKQILKFYDFCWDKQNNLFDSTHKSNLLSSQIEEWIRHTNEGQLDEHELVLLLQGVEMNKILRFREDPIYGRYRRVKYEDLLQVVSRIYRNKKVKK